ncbi:MAG: M23 family metallopeptidase [Leptospiraceae bacterium]|nr:M23 family metallopeptidase [Leptospiraceae bacterium]
MKFKALLKYLLFFLIFLQTSLISLDREKQSKILWPMEMKVPISGSFAEFRNSHMHMGCDFKTFGINGFPVLGLFDSTIKSMSYSTAGYGLSVLIFSPKLGLTARYAHLNDLHGDINGLEDLKHSLLLMGNSSGFNLNIKPNYFSVKSGSKLARTGETGSGVSHLHVEIWDGSGYINPLTLPNYSINDTNPPTIQRVFIDSDKSPTITFDVEKSEEGNYKIIHEGEISLTGKLKFKVSGYDKMISRNPNNIYGLRLVINNLTTYSKILDRMTFKEAGNRDILYDVNKSSLSPAAYVYNFFDQPKNAYSLDLSNYPDKSKVNVELILFDASGNESNILIPITVSKNNLITKSEKPKRTYSSEDKKVSIDTSKAKTIGNGFFSINKIDSLPEEIQIENFYPVGKIYEIEANNISWKNDITGSYEGSFPNKEDSLYIYDKNIKYWISLKTIKSGNKSKFTTTRVGYLTMMRDKSPPVINYPFLMNRDFNLPELKDKNMIDVFYSISDVGSGIVKRTVLLEGKTYPYEYDKYRQYIKLEIPTAIKKYKNRVIVQVQVTDKAGNDSKWFTDVITF